MAECTTSVSAALRRLAGPAGTFDAAGGVLTTGGNLVFWGTPEGYLKAADAKTGKVVWEFQTGSGVVAPPITPMASRRSASAPVRGLRWPRWAWPCRTRSGRWAPIGAASREEPRKAQIVSGSPTSVSGTGA